MNLILTFISGEQRARLKQAYELINTVFNEITIDYEEYTITDTTLYYLKRTIEYEEKFY